MPIPLDVGAFGTYTTLVPYMRQWYRIYQTTPRQGLTPSWFFGLWISAAKVV